MATFIASKKVNMLKDLKLLPTSDQHPFLIQTTADPTVVKLGFPDGSKIYYGGTIAWETQTPTVPSDVNIGESYFDSFAQYDSKGDLLCTISSLGLQGETINAYLDSYDAGNKNSAKEFASYVFSGDDTIIGSSFGDTLIGGDGNDSINGGGGNDRINGGNGKDTLTGSTGVDKFIYTSVSDSPAGSAVRDVITDFQGSAGEKIDLSAIDAFAGLSGNQRFTYIGSRAFTGTQGEVRFFNGIIQLNTGTDKVADMEIELTGVNTFRQNFLIL